MERGAYEQVLETAAARPALLPLGRGEHLHKLVIAGGRGRAVPQATDEPEPHRHAELATVGIAACQPGDRARCRGFPEQLHQRRPQTLAQVTALLVAAALPTSAALDRPLLSKLWAAQEDRAPVSRHEQNPVAIAPRRQPVRAPRAVAASAAAETGTAPAARSDLDDALIGVEGVEEERQLLLEEADLQPKSEVRGIVFERLVVEVEGLVVASLPLELGRPLVAMEELRGKVEAPPARPRGAREPGARKDRGGRVVGGSADRVLPRGAPKRLAPRGLCGQAHDLHRHAAPRRSVAADQGALYLVGVVGLRRPQQVQEHA